MDEPRNKPIVSRDPRALLDEVEARFGRATAAALAKTMIASVEAEVDELIARRDAMISRDPRLN